MRNNMKNKLEIEERARRKKREMSNITFDGQIDGWLWHINISMS